MTRAQALIAATKLAGGDLDATVVVTLRRSGRRPAGELAVEIPHGTTLDGIVDLREEVLEFVGADFEADFEAGYLELKRTAEPKR